MPGLATSTLGRRYLYRPPPADHALKAAAPTLRLDWSGPLPAEVDWRERFQWPRDQGQEGSCSGFATAAFCESWQATLPQPPDWYFSPAYLYARTRMAEGSFPSDAGATLADEFAVLQSYGVCPESYMPYSGDPTAAPNPVCDVGAMGYRCAQPCMVPWGEPDAMKTVLASGKCVAIGAELRQSFESTNTTGKVPMWSASEPTLGGHAMLMVGYGFTGWILRNSWGRVWGDGGYCYLPYGYESCFLEAWTA